MYQEDGAWKETPFKGITDDRGVLTFGPLPLGDYKLVQTSAKEGYLFDNCTYLPTDNNKLGVVTETGVFEIGEADRFGYGTIVTNERQKMVVDYQFKSKYESDILPEEVLNQLPQAQNVEYGAMVKIPAEVALQEVATVDGVWRYFAPGLRQEKEQNLKHNFGENAPNKGLN